MAIKISGNTVIDDSRNITSSGTMSANAYIGDGSQLTNLPGGGNVLEATASGTLSDGSTVIVNTDGTVSVVGQTETTGSGVGSDVTFESGNTQHISSTYDPNNQKVVVVYRDEGNSNYGTAVVGTVSGSSISFGSPSVFLSDIFTQPSAVYDSTNQKVVIAYSDGGNSSFGTAIVGTVSGTSISFGSPTVFQSSNTGYSSAIVDSNSNKVVIAYADSDNSNHGKAVVGTVSGTSISFGTPVTFESATTYWTSATYDSTNQKVVIAYRDAGNSDYGTAIVGTVSGTSISFGSPVVFESAASNSIVSTYDSTNSKVVIAYQDVGNSRYGTAIVGTVSGTSISFGTPTTFNTANASYISAVYDSNAQKVVITYKDNGNNDHGYASVGTVSGTSISFDSSFVFNSAQTINTSAVYDSNNQKVVVSYTDNAISDGGAAVVITTTGASIPQSATTVFANTDARIGSALYDSTNQKVVIAYRDRNNSSYGTAIVGTVSGTSISFGTPVVFESGYTNYLTGAYDSTNGKVVFAYQDQDDSWYGKAVVGTVSGTSISFGSPTVFQSSTTEFIGVAYDSSNQKIVISYSDAQSTPQSNYGKAVVGTVSGTSISFGSSTTFLTAQAAYMSSVYDSNAQKVVIAYRTGGTNYGTAIVGTVSGTSISFGSPSTFSSGNTTIIGATYDSSNQKVVIAYRDATNSNYGTAIVGTVSGTSISFGTPVVFNSNGNTFNVSATHDSINQKIFIAYTDAENSQYGTVIEGTVSGTSISFGSAFVFESATSYNIKAAYDSSNDKLVIGYRDVGNSNYGTTLVYTPRTMTSNLTSENYIGISDGAYTNGQSATIQLAGSVDDAQSGLTPGSKYYVQNNGTLSTTAGSPSVFAGTAAATTKLIVKN